MTIQERMNDVGIQFTDDSTKTDYYVGDLCYVMHDVWEEVCDLTFPDPYTEKTGRIVLKDGREFFIYGTAHGDGEYLDNLGRKYAVDSGTVGAIRVEDIRDPAGKELIESDCNYAHVHTMSRPLTEQMCSNFDGTILMGEVCIYTNEPDEWEADEEDEE